MKMHKYIVMLLLLWGIGIGTPAWSQTTADQPAPSTSSTTTLPSNASVEMADVMRQDGKIYIVVAVLVSVMLGILFYLISLDRKVSRLEKEFRQ